MPGRLQTLRVVDPVLTNIARGYSNAALIGEQLFPFVESVKEAGKIPNFTKDAFKLRDTERAIRAKSNVISPDNRDSIDFKLTEHDLSYPIDYREKEEDIFPAEEFATNVVTEGIRLKHEYKCATLSQTLANYATGNKTVLSGSSQFTDASSDPCGVIDDAKKALKQLIAGGVYKLKMIIGEPTYNVLKKHAQLVEKIKYSMKGILTTDLMKEIFDVENIFVGRAVYFSKTDGKFVDLWNDNIILGVVPAKPSTFYDPSYGYTIRKKGMPVIDKYDGEGGKIHYVRNTDNYEVVLCANNVGYIISDTNA